MEPAPAVVKLAVSLAQAGFASLNWAADLPGPAHRTARHLVVLRNPALPCMRVWPHDRTTLPSRILNAHVPTRAPHRALASDCQLSCYVPRWCSWLPPPHPHARKQLMPSRGAMD